MIPGAVVQVTPLSLAMWGMERRDFFAVVLTFPITGIDGRLIGAVQFNQVWSSS